MAKSSKTSSDESQPVEDDPAVEGGEDDQQTPEQPEIEEAEEISEAADDDLPTDLTEPLAEPEADHFPAPEPDPVPRSAGGAIWPLVLGGVAAAAIGYGFAIYGPMSSERADLAAMIEAQGARITALDARLSEPAPTPDFSAIEAQLEEVEDQLGATSAELIDQLAALDARIVEVEKQPGADGTLSETALAAYQRELDELRAAMDAQTNDVLSAAAQAEADLAAAREAAERLEAEAIASAEAANARAALNRISAAIETGAPFADALADLPGAEIPAALSEAAETGVATTAELSAAFPAAARAALATARAEGLSDDAGGLGGFLRQQFDVRSTTPQEGSGPDAVLSRAEAAVKDGRVADALAEIETLPEVARAEITDWTAQAQERADVLAAISSLFETYN